MICFLNGAQRDAYEEMAAIASAKIPGSAEEKELWCSQMSWLATPFLIIGTSLGGIIMVVAVWKLLTSNKIVIAHADVAESTIIFVPWFYTAGLFLIGVWMVLGTLIVSYLAYDFMDSSMEDDNESESDTPQTTSK